MLLLLATGARGDEAFDRGVERLRAGDYPAAAAAFRDAYERSHHAAPLCNLALTYDRWGGHEADAADSYRRCAGLDGGGRRRAFALARAAELEEAVKHDDPPPPQDDPAPPAPNPTPASAPPPIVVATPPPAPTPTPMPSAPPRELLRKTPLVKTWWLWTAVAGVAVAGAVVLGVELTAHRAPSTSLGAFGPNAITVVRF